MRSCLTLRIIRDSGEEDADTWEVMLGVPRDPGLVTDCEIGIPVPMKPSELEDAVLVAGFGVEFVGGPSERPPVGPLANGPVAPALG